MVDQNIDINIEKCQNKHKGIPELIKQKTDPLADKNIQKKEYQ